MVKWQNAQASIGAPLLCSMCSSSTSEALDPIKLSLPGSVEEYKILMRLAFLFGRRRELWGGEGEVL